MSFAHVPSESKTKINKAGEILRDDIQDLDQVIQALHLVDNWRACHAYPLNTFNSTLREKIKSFQLPDEPLVAQRLKRMSTIIDKLKRYPTTRLTQMQDIGGVRAILESIDDVYKLADQYREKSRFSHELMKEDNYIKFPRDEDGYRSLHLIYKYKNTRAVEYNGLYIEIQMRTKLQHSWATAVETMGGFLGQALKSRLGDKEWLDFFAAVSSAFAHIEKTPLVPRFSDLTKEKTFLKVKKAADNLKVLDQISSLTVIGSNGGIDEKKYSYHLIILNSLAHTVDLRSFARDDLNLALEQYADLESRASKGEKIEPVLVSAGPLRQLRKAYPNFFLDITDFKRRLEEIIR